MLNLDRCLIQHDYLGLVIILGLYFKMSKIIMKEKCTMYSIIFTVDGTEHFLWIPASGTQIHCFEMLFPMISLPLLM